MTPVVEELGVAAGLLGLLLAFSFAAAGARFLVKQDLVVAEVESLHAAIWQAAVAGVEARPSSMLAVLSPVNEVIDLPATRPSWRSSSTGRANECLPGSSLLRRTPLGYTRLPAGKGAKDHVAIEAAPRRLAAARFRPGADPRR